MADTLIDKIKEQYLETILHTMPLSQAAFVVLMTIVSAKIIVAESHSPLDVLLSTDLKSAFSDGGLLWTIPIAAIVSSLLLSILNTALLNTGLRRSFLVSKVGDKLAAWRATADSSISVLPSDKLPALLSSFRDELVKRQKKYGSKRIAAEVTFSLAACVLYGSAFTLLRNLDSIETLSTSIKDVAVLFALLIIFAILHRHSVRYAIEKVIPLQVFICAAAGDLIFIDGVE
jgi:hypothetical protein